MAPHSSTLAWKIPWMEGPGRLQSMGSLGVGHDWATSLSLFTFMHWRRKWQPTPVFLPGESQGRRTWWAAIYGVTQSRIRLKRLSSSRSSSLILADTACSMLVRPLNMILLNIYLVLVFVITCFLIWFSVYDSWVSSHVFLSKWNRDPKPCT